LASISTSNLQWGGYKFKPWLFWLKSVVILFIVLILLPDFKYYLQKGWYVFLPYPSKFTVGSWCYLIHCNLCIWGSSGSGFIRSNFKSPTMPVLRFGMGTLSWITCSYVTLKCLQISGAKSVSS
jgi:hypothetical protein